MHINYSSDPKSLNLCRFSGESDSPARRGLAQHYQWIGCLQVIRLYHLAIIGIINFAIIIVNLFVMTVMMIQVPWTPKALVRFQQVTSSPGFPATVQILRYHHHHHHHHLG